MADTTHSNSAWDAIEQSRRFDRFVRRTCIAAWTGAFVVVLVFGALEVAKPLLIMVGALCVLIATLTTVGIFIRQRAASLAEIQVRLAALEDILEGQNSAP